MTSSRNDTIPVELIGPSFLALQVRDLEASRAFYVETIGLKPLPQNPPGAIVFSTRPVPFAIRTPLVDLDATNKLGWGVSIWMAATDADAVHDQLVEAGVKIVLAPADGPFGRFFAFRDLDGYTITVHTVAPDQESKGDR
jgi:catechol 2,3-dioxygenase-like lactoylglutathione lyase family enzyme